MIFNSFSAQYCVVDARDKWVDVCDLTLIKREHSIFNIIACLCVGDILKTLAPANFSLAFTALYKMCPGRQCR